MTTKFDIIAREDRARVGKLTTSHGVVNTPVFLPVGTQATVKAVDGRDLDELGAEMILANTYHLYLRPGSERIQKLGGLHKFMDWKRPILTDSGGFQVFSLGFGIEHEVGKIVNLYGDNLVVGNILDADSKTVINRTKLCKIEEDGPTFQSHIDGIAHFFPPEKSVDVQIELGADFIVALDECTSPLHDYDYTKTSMERSHRWEKRSLDELIKFQVHGSRFTVHGRTGKLNESVNSEPDSTVNQQMFGVVQGGPFEDLRIESAKFVSENDFFGMGIGGALVSKEKMHEILDWIFPHLHPEKPRHLLGIGTVDDIFEGVSRGMDIFDCVYPTRIARAGLVLYKLKKDDKKIAEIYNHRNFYYDISKTIFVEDGAPIDEDCTCYTCQHYSRAYVHHMFRSHELLSYRLATIHNIHFMLRLLEEIRQAIIEKRFAKLKEEWLQYNQ